MFKSNLITLELDWGEVVIECLPQLAPLHVNRMQELVNQGFYDGLAFHRADERMVQTGDRLGNGLGETGVRLTAEFSKETEYERGDVCMARMPDDENSGDCQFFIVRQPQLQLPMPFTVWGRVVKGIENIDQDKIPDGTEFRDLTIDGTEVSVGSYVSNPKRIIQAKTL